MAPAVPAKDFGVAIVAAALDIVLFTRVMEADNLQGRTVFDAPISAVVVLGLIAVPALALRHRAPTAVCLTLATYAALLTVTVGSRPLVTLLVALYTVAASQPRSAALLCLFATLGAHGVSVRYEVSSSVDSWKSVAGIATLYAVLDGAVWAAGRWAADARARARQLVETRAAMAAEAVNVERLRIARELHDIVAHAVTVMILQTDGARRCLRTEPALADETLTSVLSVGREAMVEMRRLLEVLRTVSVDDAERLDSADRLATLPALTDRVQAAGIAVRVETSGDVGRLDPSVDLAAFRVVQEALTNTTRHAGPGTRADVQLNWADRVLEIVITDDGAGVPEPGARELSSGYGFLGLGERVKLVGGQIHHGRVPTGGYQVCATLPAGLP